MKEEILTAKEWLEKEELYSCTKEYRNKIELAAEEVDLFIYMEKYANYKNRILEDRIKEFRKVLVDNAYPGIPIAENVADPVTLNAWHDYASTNITIKEYDKHFNIENKQ